LDDQRAQQVDALRLGERLSDTESGACEGQARYASGVGSPGEEAGQGVSVRVGELRGMAVEGGLGEVTGASGAPYPYDAA
jgi:hypothetical protein